MDVKNRFNLGNLWKQLRARLCTTTLKKIQIEAIKLFPFNSYSRPSVGLKYRGWTCLLQGDTKKLQSLEQRRPLAFRAWIKLPVCFELLATAPSWASLAGKTSPSRASGATSWCTSELPCATLTKTHYEEKEEAMRIFCCCCCWFFWNSSGRSPNAQRVKTQVCTLRIPSQGRLWKAATFQPTYAFLSYTGPGTWAAKAQTHNCTFWKVHF